MDKRFRDVPYLGDFPVVSGLLVEFSQKVMMAYDGFLRGSNPKAEAEIRGVIKTYADYFGGRSPEYEFPPWLDQRFSLLRSAYELGWDNQVDACTGWLEFLANMSINALKDLVLHHKTEAETAPKLGEILRDAALLYLKIHGPEGKSHARLVPKFPC